jgi:hypothetical protein
MSVGLSFDCHKHAIRPVAGSAIAKSGKPRSKDHVAAALDKLLNLVPDQPLSQNKQQRKQRQ